MNRRGKDTPELTGRQQAAPSEQGDESPELGGRQGLELPQSFVDSLADLLVADIERYPGEIDESGNLRSAKH